MTCEECRDDIAPFAAGDLPPTRSDEIARHIEECAQCRRELDEELALRRVVHNAAIPFRDSVRRGESAAERRLGAGEPEAPRVRFTRRRRTQAIAAGALAALAAFVALVFLRPRGNEIESISAWAVDHYPLVDQTHQIHGNADDVRLWFRTHHGIDIIPPRDADYTSLTGCKMTDMGEDPVPLLRFDANVTTAVFILPARLEPTLRGAEVRGLRRGDFVIDVWSEGPGEFLRITREKNGS